MSIGFLHMDFLDAIQDKGTKINQVFVNIFLSIFILYRAEQCLLEITTHKTKKEGRKLKVRGNEAISLYYTSGYVLRGL